METVMWTFKTRNFKIEWIIAPCYDLDLSWCETGETRENLESGLWQAFDSEIRVSYRGAIVGQDYLGQSIYENPEEFRDHIGMNARGHGSYFSDMVKEAIKEARKNLSDVPRLRAA